MSMEFCPLMSYREAGTSEVYCPGERCALAGGENNRCLIKQALECYVNEKRNAERFNSDPELCF